MLDSSGRKIGDPIGEYPYKPSSRPWFETGLKTKDGHTGWSALYTWASTQDDPPVGLGRTLMVQDARGELLALVDISVSVDELSTYLKEINLLIELAHILYEAHGAHKPPQVQQNASSRGPGMVWHVSPILRRV